jgi:hypothetical protein
MADFRDVTDLINLTYHSIWQDWYANSRQSVPAILSIDLNCTDAGYSSDRNQIIISIGDGNLDDFDILDATAWPIWKYQLIHEMLHEYADKVLAAPSEAGIVLCQSGLRRFWGPGHEALFFTAICDRAPYFGLTPAEFLKRI